MVCSLVSMCFNSLQIGKQWKQLYENLEIVLAIVLLPHFVYDFSRKMFLMLTKFHCLIAFTSWDIVFCVYCNCLFLRLWCYDKKVKTKMWISWEQKELLRWNKKTFFIIFKGLSVAKNYLRRESASLNG